MLTFILGCMRSHSPHILARESVTILIGRPCIQWRELIAYNRMMSDYEVTLVNDNSKQLSQPISINLESPILITIQCMLKPTRILSN